MTEDEAIVDYKNIMTQKTVYYMKNPDFNIFGPLGLWSSSRHLKCGKQCRFFKSLYQKATFVTIIYQNSNIYFFTSP